MANINGTGTINFKSNDVYGKLNGGTYMYSDTVKFIFVDSTEGVTVINGRQTYDFTRGNGKIIAQALKDGEITAVFVNSKADVANLQDVIFVSSRYRTWDEVITRENGQKVQSTVTPPTPPTARRSTTSWA